MSLPRIDLFADPKGASDLVLVAHGGRQQSREEPPEWGHALLRMLPFVDIGIEAVPAAAVGLVRYRYRGWNHDSGPLRDVRQVLDAAAERGFERAVLVGHSMGGRAVVGAGAHPIVRGIGALAPWLHPSDDVPDVTGRVVVLAHGLNDRITSPAMTAAFAERSRWRGHDVAWFTVEGDSHALLRRGADWDELVRRVITSSLTDDVDDVIAAATTADPARGADALPRWHRARPALTTILRVTAARRRLRPVASVEVD